MVNFYVYMLCVSIDRHTHKRLLDIEKFRGQSLVLLKELRLLSL